MRITLLALPLLLLLYAACRTNAEVSAGAWSQLETQLIDHVHAAQDAEKANNQQGMLDALTKIAGDCRQAGTLPHGGSAAEAQVRKTCAAGGDPIP